MEDHVSPYIDMELRAAMREIALKYSGEGGEEQGERALAEALGFSPSALSRWTDPFADGDPRYFPLDHLSRFIAHTKSLKPLEYLARKCGCFLVKFPRGKKRTGAELPEFNRAAAEVSLALARFFDGLDSKDEVEKKIIALMRLAEGYRRIVKTERPGEPYLPGQE